MLGNQQNLLLSNQVLFKRELFALPARLGGLGILDPVKRATEEFAASLRVTAPLKALIIQQDPTYPMEALEEQVCVKSEIHVARCLQQSGRAGTLTPTLPTRFEHLPGHSVR